MRQATRQTGHQRASPGAQRRHKSERIRLGLRWALSAIYLTAGILHLRNTADLVLIVPGWVPDPTATVIVTGYCELLGAVALHVGKLRWLAGLSLALYAVCVYPANLKHAFDHVAIGGTRLGWFYHAPRLAFQPVLVWWALFCGGIIDWPFRRHQTHENV